VRREKSKVYRKEADTKTCLANDNNKTETTENEEDMVDQSATKCKDVKIDETV